jgi:glycosyltransferase involved in cell wall biosynthesis
VSKHVYQMVTGLARREGFNLRLLVSRDQAASGDLLAKSPFANFPTFSLPIPHRVSRHLWEHSDLGAVDRYCPSDGWIYCPMTLSVPVRKMRQACTFHGFPYFEQRVPGYNSWSRRILRYRSRLQAAKAVRRSRLLLAVSEYAKNELVWLTGVQPERVKIVCNGVEPIFFDTFDKPREKERESSFYLAVGGLNVWDGAKHILDAARELARRAPGHQVFVAGNQNHPEYIRIAQGMSNVRLLGYVPAAQLAEWMRRARALWFLPNVESFGITALEAMAAGTPVVSSRLTGVPDTVGDAAWMVDIANPVEIVDASLELCRNSSLRADYIAKGRARAGQFTWEACVDRLANALREADAGRS